MAPRVTSKAAPVKAAKTKIKKIIAIATFLLFTSVANAQDLNSESNYEGAGDPSPSGQVLLEKQENYLQSYKKRRGAHGALFSVSKEEFYPLDYRSLFDDSFIEDIIQEKRIDMVTLELGYKYNFAIMSVAVLGVYSQGRVRGAISGAERIINISKQGLAANIALDAIFEEPWAVPYAQVGVHQFNISESAINDSLSATTSFAFNYKVGFLLQLDWLENMFDTGSKAERIRSSGLENTFLDIYFAQHFETDTAIDPTNLTTDGDPNLSSSGEMGIGLKLEF